MSLLRLPTAFIVWENFAVRKVIDPALENPLTRRRSEAQIGRRNRDML